MIYLFGLLVLRCSQDEKVKKKSFLRLIFCFVFCANMQRAAGRAVVKHSGLQRYFAWCGCNHLALTRFCTREILSLYRQMLRAAQNVSGSNESVLQKIRDTFRARAAHPRRDVDQISHWLHRGRVQLKMLQDKQVQKVTVFSAKDTHIESKSSKI